MSSRRSLTRSLSSRGKSLAEEPSEGASAATPEEEEFHSGILLPSSSSSSSPTDERSMCGLTELVSSCLSSHHHHHDKASTSLSPSSSSSDVIPDKARNGNTRSPTRETEKSKYSSRNGGHSDSQPFLRSSLFSNVPPTIRFYTKGTKVSRPNRRFLSKLSWCHNSLLPIVMRQSLAASHFRIVDESHFWIGYWGRHLKSADYKNIKPYQKVNHFPGAFHVGRKDRLWMHIADQIAVWGEEYRIIPVTYILPREMETLQLFLAEHPTAHVILKPPASARGTGITVTRRLKDIKPNTPMVAQHYIDRPMTINGAKFDLRLYAYVPCFEPLRIYLYEEGLVRFASIPYSHCISSYSNRYMHLTNYSINKLAEKDGVLNTPVPKWRLTELWRYLEKKDIQSSKVRQDIEDVIIKAFIACEKPLREHMVRQIHSGFVCHELFGVDILLDEDARPWLLEVNISPSLHSGTALDSSVKAPLAKDVLNLAGIYVSPNATPDTYTTTSVYKTRPRKWPKSTRQLAKEGEVEESYSGEGLPSGRCTARLTSEDTKMLVEFEDELRRAGDFKLLYPTAKTVDYLKYFAQPVYANLLLARWQVEQNRDRKVGITRLEMLCHDGIVLQDARDEESSEEDGEYEEESDSEEDEEGEAETSGDNNDDETGVKTCSFDFSFPLYFC